MHKGIGAVKLSRILFPIIMAFLLPFHAFAYTPSIITQTLPEATAGAFYHVQLLTEGFGQRVLWSAEGLPDGLEIDPISGIVFGTAKQSGVFEVVVTAQSGWRWWRFRTDSKRFHLNVLPQPVEDTAPPPTPDTPATSIPPVTPPSGTELSANAPAAPESQNDAEAFIVLGEDGPPPNVQWSDTQPNSESGADTTALILTFSGNPKIGEHDYRYSNYIQIEENAEFDLDSFSCELDAEGRYIYTLGIKNIDKGLKDGDKIKVSIVDLSESGVILNQFSMLVPLHFATPEPSDADKVLLALEELKQADMLGTNTSSSSITDNLTLPFASTVAGCIISWRSSESGVISDSGVVVRPEYGDVEVTLTATAVCNDKSADADFIFVVIAMNEGQFEPQPQPQPQLESKPESSSGASSALLADVASSTSRSNSSQSSIGTNRARTNVPVRISSNVGENGVLSRISVLNELKSALQDVTRSFAVIKTKNALNVSPKTLKALATTAKAEGKKAVLHADTVTQIGKVDARLYIKPEILSGITEPIKLGIATQGIRPEQIKRFFEKHFDNEVAVISCEQQGSFGARLQIAAKIKLPEDTGNLVFYSYDTSTNTFSRILTAYRIDANGYLRFATEIAGDIVVSNGTLKKH